MTATLTPPSTTHNPPPTKKGWVNTFYRHYKGKKLGPYHVRRWKVGRKIHREYIKPADLERVKAECQAYKEHQQQRREGARRVNTYLSNWDFMGQMLERYDRRKEVSKAQEAYILRIHREGLYITGIPSLRRRVTRNLVKIAGEEFIVKTVFELDGTTKVFMVPFLAKFLVNPFDRLKRMAMDAWDSAHHRNIGPPGDDSAGRNIGPLGDDSDVWDRLPPQSDQSFLSEAPYPESAIPNPR